MAQRKVGGKTSTRRLRDYDARRREMTDAFNLPPDTRMWVTVRMDSDPDVDDSVSVCARAGQTNTIIPLTLPADLKRTLKALLDEHQGELEHRLKLDLATNLLAAMSGAFDGAEDDEGTE